MFFKAERAERAAQLARPSAPCARPSWLESFWALKNIPKNVKICSNQLYIVSNAKINNFYFLKHHFMSILNSPYCSLIHQLTSLHALALQFISNSQTFLPHRLCFCNKLLQFCTFLVDFLSQPERLCFVFCDKKRYTYDHEFITKEQPLVRAL